MEFTAREALRLDADPRSLLPIEWKREGNQYSANEVNFILIYYEVPIQGSPKHNDILRKNVR